MCSDLGPVYILLLFLGVFAVTIWIEIAIVKRVFPGWYNEEMLGDEARVLIATPALLFSIALFKILGCW